MTQGKVSPSRAIVCAIDFNHSTTQHNPVMIKFYQRTLLRGPILCLLCFIIGLPLAAQPFNSLYFDGLDDYVDVPVGSITNPVLDTFTVEMWFRSDAEPLETICSLGSRNALGIASADHSLVVAECVDQLFVNQRGAPGDPSIPFMQAGTLPPNTWQLLRLDVVGDTTILYINCQERLRFEAIWGGPIQEIRIGSAVGFQATVGERSWLGEVDEFRLYPGLRRIAASCTAPGCIADRNDPQLLVYYDFNQGAAAGANQGIIAVEDRSMAPVLDGPIFNFALSGPTSNFVASDAPLLAEILLDLPFEIRSYPYLTDVLDTICSGDPVQFCLGPNGPPPAAMANVAVTWQSSDDLGGSWQDLVAPPFTDFCFPLQPGVITLDCLTSTTGATDRLFRASMVATDPTSGNTCSFFSEVDTLHIRCPLMDVAVTINPNAPLCSGDDVVLAVSLVSSHPWLNPLAPGDTIRWTVDAPGQTQEVLTNFSTQPSFSYPYTAPAFSAPQSVTITASIKDCDGALRSYSASLTIDPKPVAARLTGLPEVNPTNLTLLTPGPNPVYDICPGEDATLGEVGVFVHQFCRTQWQYTFDLTGTVNWVDLGTSNDAQNTNILPTAQWGSATSIYYRQRCDPLSVPSGCDPVYSDTLEVQLRPEPAAPIISGPSVVCLNDAPVTLSVSNPDPAAEYFWFQDGLPVAGPVLSFTTATGGNFQVEAHNGCVIVPGPVFVLTEREVVPLISCPLLPNDCVNPGDDVTLSAGASFVVNDPSATLSYSWSASSGETGAGTTFTYTTHPNTTPPLTPTTITLIVMDATNGCTVTTQRTITPCGNRW